MAFRASIRCLQLVSVLLIPTTVFAYVGPGAGLGAIGAFLALIGALVFGIVGFVWYPIKRILRRNKKDVEIEGDDSAANTDSAEEKQETSESL